MFEIFKKITKIFFGLGLGKIPVVKRLFDFLFSRLKPKGINMIDTVAGKLWVDTNDTGEVPYLLLRGVYDELETSLIKNLLKPGMVALDIGAHIGYFTVIMAKAVGKEGKVFAFEPEPTNRELLEKNIKLNNLDNVDVSSLALSNSKGKKKLYIDKKNLGNPSFSDRNIPSENIGRILEVDTITLDEYFGDKKADFLKIDVQGAEGLVFKGATKLLSGNTRILIEFWPSGLRNVGTDPMELLSQLEQNGYSFEIIDGSKGYFEIKDSSRASKYFWKQRRREGMGKCALHKKIIVDEKQKNKNLLSNNKQDPLRPTKAAFKAFEKK